MMRRCCLPLIVVMVFASLAPCRAFAQEPQLIVEVDRESVYEGESLIYNVLVSGSRNPQAPTIAPADTFDIDFIGEQSLNQRMSVSINGVEKTTVRLGHQYQYRITPHDAGTLRIPAPTAMIDGVQVSGQAIEVRVIAPTPQDLANLELAIEPPSVYPMQPFTVRLDIRVRELPDPFRKENPLGVQSAPPELSIPWLTDDAIADGITPESDWQTVVRPLISRGRAGFAINNIGDNSVFSMFERRMTTFEPPFANIEQSDEDGNAVGYRRYRIERTFLPKRVGSYTFDAVTLKGTFAAEVRNKQAVGQAVFAVSRPVTIDVRPVPLAGRPESFIGAIGTFDVSSELSPTTARVGDPLTFTLRLTGQGMLDVATAPDLSRIDAIADNFRLYDPTEESGSGHRQFTWSLRPTNDGIRKFPEVPISWFDVKSEQYVIVNTKTVPLEIAPADVLSGNQIVADRPDTTNLSGDLAVNRDGIFGNHADVRQLRNESIHPPAWMLSWLGLIGSWIVGTRIVDRVRSHRADPSVRRRSGAADRARRALRAALDDSATGSQSPAARMTQLQSVFTGFIADMTDATEAALTPRDAEQRMREHGFDAGLTDRAVRFLEQCDAARYGASDLSAPEREHEAESLLSELIAAVGR